MLVFRHFSLDVRRCTIAGSTLSQQGHNSCPANFFDMYMLRLQTDSAFATSSCPVARLRQLVIRDLLAAPPIVTIAASLQMRQELPSHA